MISNLREKLKTISTISHSKPKEDGGEDIALLRGDLSGEVVNSQWGQHICKRIEYPRDHYYGSICFKGIEEVDIPMSFKWARLEGEVEGFSIYDLLFLDTETTGLSGGTGTLAFLIGLGYFTKDSFVVEQHIMRDFYEELPMLKHIGLQTLGIRVSI